MTVQTHLTRRDGTPLQMTHIVLCDCGARPGEPCRCDLPPIVCIPENATFDALTRHPIGANA